MSSFDNGQRSSRTSGLQLPGLVSELSPAEQLPFPESSTSITQTMPRSQQYGARSGLDTPAQQLMVMPDTQPLSDTSSATRATQQLTFNASPAVTRILPDLQTGSLPSTRTTTSLRQPIVIRGSGKKSPRTMRPPKGRSWVVSTSILAVMIVMSFLTAFVVFPLATGNHPFSSPLFGGNNLVKNMGPNINSNSLSAQKAAASATAFVRQDGYDPMSNNVGQPTGSDVTADHFAYGNCTYWADLRYHQLTGYWVAWIGNAYQWAAGASAAGWIVSSKPHVPSIMVLAPGVEGAGGYGHVAVVERINSDGSVYASNMNWYSNGGWDIVSYVTFTPGAGVSFVWHP